MTTEEKLGAIARFETSAGDFDGLPALPVEVLTFRPFPEAWTIHEHIVHMLESEVAAFHRYRRAVAQPGTAALGYDEEIWTPCLGYHEQDLADCLAAFKLLRRIAAAHLRRIADRDWTSLAYVHDSQGRVDLEAWIRDYTDHVAIHLGYIQRNLSAAGKRGLSTGR
jgi:hypothetical protein